MLKFPREWKRVSREEAPEEVIASRATRLKRSPDRESKAGRKSGYPKKGRGTSGCFDFGQAGQIERSMILRVVDR